MQNKLETYLDESTFELDEMAQYKSYTSVMRHLGSCISKATTPKTHTLINGFISLVINAYTTNNKILYGEVLRLIEENTKKF